MAAIIGVISIMRISTLPMAALGVAGVVAFSFTASWDEVFVGGVKPRQILLFGGLALLFLGHAVEHRPVVPWWINAFGVGSLLGTAALALFPVSSSYLATRYLSSAAGQSLLSRPGALPALLSVLVNLYAVPLAIIMACNYNRRAIYWIINAFVSGVALSSAAAYLGFRGHDFLLRPLVAVIPPAGTRALGYANHPLHLATSCVFSIGLACWMAVQTHSGTRWAGRLYVILIVLGVYASGSRGGNVATVVIIALSATLLPSIRQRVHNLVALLGTAVAGIILFVPSVGLTVLHTSRIYGGTSSAASDSGRSELSSRAILDFKESPVFGIGLRFVSEAHTLYFGIVASGGVLLLTAYVAFNIGSVRALFKSMSNDRTLGGALFATIVGSAAYWTVADEFAVADVFLIYGLIAVSASSSCRPPTESLAEPDKRPSREGVSQQRREPDGLDHLGTLGVTQSSEPVRAATFVPSVRTRSPD